MASIDGSQKKRKSGFLSCEVRQGTLRDAIKYSLSANVEHGLRRTNADKRRAVEIAIADEEWRQLSDRAIADMCGVSNNFVGTIRAATQVSSDDTSSTPPIEKRLGRDGKRQSAKKMGTSGSRAPVDSMEAESGSGPKTVTSGTSAVAGNEKALFTESIGVVVSSTRTLGVYDEFSDCLKQLISRVEDLK
jgi:hypothetical protein